MTEFVSKSVYTTLICRVALVKVPGPKTAHTKLVEAHEMKVAGKKIAVAAHYRNGFLAQAGNESGKRRVLVHRNFFVPEDLLGRTITATVEVVLKSTEGVGDNIVLNIRPAADEAEAECELKLMEGRRDLEDIRIPDTGMYVHFKPLLS